MGFCLRQLNGARRKRGHESPFIEWLRASYFAKGLILFVVFTRLHFVCNIYLSLNAY